MVLIILGNIFTEIKVFHFINLSIHLIIHRVIGFEINKENSIVVLPRKGENFCLMIEISLSRNLKKMVMISCPRFED